MLLAVGKPDTTFKTSMREVKQFAQNLRDVSPEKLGVPPEPSSVYNGFEPGSRPRLVSGRPPREGSTMKAGSIALALAIVIVGCEGSRGSERAAGDVLTVHQPAP